MPNGRARFAYLLPLSHAVRSLPGIGKALRRVAACLFLATAVLSGPAQADVSGLLSVSDGDTVEVGGNRVRVYGIDAPESRQTCCDGGTAWQCGRQATRALAGRADGRHAVCGEKDRDRYGRIVALCRVDGRDLGAWMVSQGWALAYRRYSDAYASEEASASAARRGIWRGRFVAPWDWRAGTRLPSSCGTTKPDASDCRIKGNIARDGERIYHLPGWQYYERTRIDPAKGERWFCTEAEARAAGWRGSRR